MKRDWHSLSNNLFFVVYYLLYIRFIILHQTVSLNSFFYKDIFMYFIVFINYCLYHYWLCVCVYIYIPKSRILQNLQRTSQNRHISCWTILFKCGGEKKIVKVRVSRTRLHYVFRHFCHCTIKTTRSLSGGKIESFFRLFTKFNSRKTNTSQNSIYRHESYLHFLEIPLFKAFQIVTFCNFCAK